MKKRLAFAALLLIAACSSASAPMDPNKVLDSFGGPKVQTMDDSLRDSAKKAEDEGDFNTAAQYYQQMLEHKPDDTDLAFSLAESYRRGGDPDKAIALYDQILAKNPQMASARESKGLALISKGDFASPTPLFEEVLKAEPNRWKTLNALGILFSTRNMQPEAQQYFNAALKNHEGSPAIYNNLGLSQALSRNFDDAIHSLQKASDLAGNKLPERKRIDLNLALVYASAGKLDDAKVIAQNYLEGAALDNNLGLYAHLAKDDQMARAYLNMALTESKTYYAKAWDNLQDISANGNDNATPAATRNPMPNAVNSKPAQPTATVPADLFPVNDVPPTE